VHIRAFDGTLRDAQGIIAVDGETFGDCPYTAAHIADLGTSPRQRVWVACADGKIVGFVSAFATHSLAADRWEIDELAVRPAAQGRGIGTALVARALELPLWQPSPFGQVRTLVAMTNVPSQRAFAKNGFSSAAWVHLLVRKMSAPVPELPEGNGPTVRRAQAADVPALSKLSGCAADRIAALLQRPPNRYLIAGQGQAVQGYAELIHVYTLQYEGLWIESIATVDEEYRTASALLGAAIKEARRHSAVDRIGYLGSPRRSALYTASLDRGFAMIDEYLIFNKTLNTQCA
jgi:ribosomal protein S18 acetylase RimI-like enzyme